MVFPEPESVREMFKTCSDEELPKLKEFVSAHPQQRWSWSEWGKFHAPFF